MYRILRLPEVMNRTGLAKSTVYKKMAEKTFPAPVSLGAKSVGWLDTDINAWIQARITQSQPDMKSSRKS